MSTTVINEDIASLMGELAGQADPYPIYRRMHALGEAVDAPDGTVQHTRLRRLVSRSFTAQRVAGMRDAITRIAEELCEPLSGTIEFVDSVAFPFPVTVIGELLGIPAADRAMFQPLVREWTSVLEILNPLAVDTADAAAVQIQSYLRELVRVRRERPADDDGTTGQRLPHAPGRPAPG